jgi:RHS repeat-associated protein
MTPSRFRRYWPVLLLLPFLAMGMYRMLIIRPLAVVSQGPIGNGQMLTGSVAPGNTDSWSFYETSGSHVIVLNADTTDAGTDFEPWIAIVNPNGTNLAGFTAASPGVRVVSFTPAQTGTYTAQVKNAQTNMFTGTVHVNLNLSNVPYSIAPGASGGVIYSSTNYSGTIAAHKINMHIWNYTAKAGDSLVFKLTSSGTVSGRAYVNNPNGSNNTSSSGTGTLTYNVSPAVTGSYTFFVGDSDASATAANNYTVKVTGSSVLPTDGKEDIASACVTGGCNGGLGDVDKTGYVNAGEPINLATGNVSQLVTDYTTKGTNPLAFTRAYNSMSYTRNLQPTMMGADWRNNFDRYLLIVLNGTSKMAAAQRASGQVLNFYCGTGTTCTPDTDVDASLTVSGSTWTLTDSDDTVETYTVASGVGTLNSIKLRNGYTQTMHYTTGKLTSVTDTYGRTLGLTYTGSVVTGVTTPDSLSLTYGYTTVNSQSLLTSVSYSTSPTTTLTYVYGNTNLPFALTGITDENGHGYATWAYDGQGRATSSQLAGGVNFTSVTYFDNNGNRAVTGPQGVTETYKFTTLQGASKVSEIDRASNGTVASATETFLYDTNGFIKSLTDWNSNNTWFTNNSHGLPTAIVFASGSAVTHTTSITYDSTWARLAHVVTTTGLTSTLNYSSSNGTLLSRVDSDTTSQVTPYSTNGQSRTWTMTYTSTGQMTSFQLPRTDVTAKTTLTWTGGVLTNVQDALGHNTNVATYKAGGWPLTVRDVNHTLTTLAYSPRLWLTSSVMASSSGNLTTSLTYDSAGELTKTTLPDSSFLSNTYDNAHQLTKTTNALSETANFTFNSSGGMTQTLWKNASAVTKRQHTATFDAMNRMATDVGGVSQTTTYGYDSDSNITKITDPLSHVTNQTFDALNRLSTHKDAELNQTQYTYDAHDRPLTVTDGKSNATSYVYDGWGDIIQQASPDSGTTIYYYDKDSNVTTKKDASIQYTSATYDALERPLTRTYPADSSLNVAFTYDQSGHGSGVGHLTSVTDQAGSLSLSYEQRGLITANNRTISSQAYNTGYTYESAGHLATITYASAGWKLTNVRDSAGQITSITDKPPSSAAVNLATSITHMPFGPVATLTYGNGVTDARTFDLDYRMTSVKDVGTGNIQYTSYGYDADNNVHTVTDNVTAGNDQTLTYNRIDALASATGVYGTVGSVTYDSNSNRLTYGATTYTVPAGSDKMSAIGASSITYSSTGNITGIGTTPTFTWNKANQMATGVLSGTTSTYLYDAFGNRLKVTVGTGVPSVTEYDTAGNIIFENNTRVETDYAYLDGFPIAAIQPVAATVSAIHTDHLGTPQFATNSSKTVVFSANYDPNGETTPTTTITQNLRMPGQYNDATALYHNGARDYLPNFALAGGRYAEVDPLGIAAGINPYIYVRNNPFKNIDPMGLWQLTVTLTNKYGVAVTGSIGINSGQANAQFFVGGGKGSSIEFNPNDSGTVIPHFDVGGTINGRIGNILIGANASAFYGEWDKEFDISGGIPYTPLVISFGEDNGEPEPPTFSVVYGNSEFAGFGFKSFGPVDPFLSSLSNIGPSAPLVGNTPPLVRNPQASPCNVSEAMVP